MAAYSARQPEADLRTVALGLPGSKGDDSGQEAGASSFGFLSYALVHRCRVHPVPIGIVVFERTSASTPTRRAAPSDIATDRVGGNPMVADKDLTITCVHPDLEQLLTGLDTHRMVG